MDTWREFAACKHIDPDFFFPVKEDTVSGRHGVNRNDVEEQRKSEYCANCPVQKPCLEYALKFGVEGIWGNTTDEERKRISRRRRRAS